MVEISSNTRKRAQTIELLAALRLEIPSQTKIPDDKLEKRLKRAISCVQYLSSAIPSPPLIPNSLPKWDDEGLTLIQSMIRQNLEQALLTLAALESGRPIKANYADPLHDLQQTVGAMVQNWTKGLHCCVVEDLNKEKWAINIRVSLLSFTYFAMYVEQHVCVHDRCSCSKSGR